MANAWQEPQTQLLSIFLKTTNLCEKNKIIICKNFHNIIDMYKLTHYSPMWLIYTPWKHPKTLRFSHVFRGYRWATPGRNKSILVFHYAIINIFLVMIWIRDHMGNVPHWKHQKTGLQIFSGGIEREQWPHNLVFCP